MEESRANFLESRAHSTSRNAPARGTVSGRQTRGAKPTRGALASLAQLRWELLSRTGRLSRAPCPGFLPSYRSLAQRRGHFPGKPVPGCAVGGASEGRWDHSVPLQGALLVAVRDPLHSLPISERGQRVRVATFPTRVAVPEEGVGASRSAEERWGKVLVFSEKHPVFQASGHLISHSFYV